MSNEQEKTLTDAPACLQRMPLIGDPAPAFTADTTQGKINFPEDYKGKWVVFFSHPSDFTPVCTSEFMTFAHMADEFRKLDAELVGISVDSLSSHIAWLRKITDELEYNGIKRQKITFPLVADLKMDVSKKYGMIHPGASDTKTVRAVFVIDPKGVIRAIIYYPASTGRNMEEIKRLVISLQATDKEPVSTPANWKPGDDVLMNTPASLPDALQRVKEADENGYKCQDWFFCFKPLGKK